MLNQDQTQFILEAISYYMNGDSFDYINNDEEVVMTAADIQQLVEDLQQRRY